MKKESSGVIGIGLLIVIGFAAIALRVVDIFTPEKVPTADVPAVAYEDVVSPPVVDTPVTVPDVTPTPDTDPTTTPTRIPASLNLAVPFTSQAPYAVWDPLHEDACEEAAVYMVNEYYAGNTAAKLDPAVVDPELKAMVAAEEAAGLGPSVTLAQLQAFLAAYDGTASRIIENPTVEDLKREVAMGNPVIVPAAGRLLGNPFFAGEGPLYHMLVIRGYTETDFITNEPGTRRGEQYTYDYATLMRAMGDWNDGNPVEGAKRVMIIAPKTP